MKINRLHFTLHININRSPTRLYRRNFIINSPTLKPYLDHPPAPTHEITLTTLQITLTLDNSSQPHNKTKILMTHPICDPLMALNQLTIIVRLLHH